MYKIAQTREGSIERLYANQDKRTPFWLGVPCCRVSIPIVLGVIETIKGLSSTVVQ